MCYTSIGPFCFSKGMCLKLLILYMNGICLTVWHLHERLLSLLHSLAAGDIRVQASAEQACLHHHSSVVVFE